MPAKRIHYIKYDDQESPNPPFNPYGLNVAQAIDALHLTPLQEEQIIRKICQSHPYYCPGEFE